jgi:hypothetical protein
VCRNTLIDRLVIPLPRECNALGYSALRYHHPVWLPIHHTSKNTTSKQQQVGQTGPSLRQKKTGKQGDIGVGMNGYWIQININDNLPQPY